MRIEREKELEEEWLSEQYKKQRKWKEAKQREEEQKLLELEKEVRRRRGELFDYKFGDKTRLDNFHGLQIEDVTKLRIGVFGPTGSGKSCFINTCERAVREYRERIRPGQHHWTGGDASHSRTTCQRCSSTWSTSGASSTTALTRRSSLRTSCSGNSSLVITSTVYADGQASSQDMPQCPEFGQRLHGIIIVESPPSPLSLNVTNWSQKTTVKTPLMRLRRPPEVLPATHSSCGITTKRNSNVTRK
ncbi:hypothetical protein OS493_010528 [Desmophyllum pertusum]|uniref:Uncharacterized protein n=1 Tax=Desmophyllum pertusum TaxID=174260 RepID=A0A9X0A3S1_9CNID|nr:hypothetical protein OS493_010528 [Desmophyllum pertusum]